MVWRSVMISRPAKLRREHYSLAIDQEQTAFAENAVQYQTTLSFLNGRIGQLTRALRGD